MGKVAIIFKVMPSDVNCDINEIEQEIKSIKNVNDVKIEEIGFGLKSIKVLVVVDNPEEANQIEEQIRKIKNVGEVQVEGTTLV
jgi:elongation factor 1-beta